METKNSILRNNPPPVNLYVITGKNGLIFDAGYGRKNCIRNFISEMDKIKKHCSSKNMECNVSRILPSHTHGDHFSGAKKLRQELGLSIILTHEMSGKISSRDNYLLTYREQRNNPRPGRDRKRPRALPGLNIARELYYKKLFGVDFVPDPDIIIDCDSTIDINGRKWEIFPSPGHTSDHISLYDPEEGILFAGDNILRSVTTWLGPPESDIMEYIKSLEKIRSLPGLNLVLPAHGSPVTDPHRRIKEIIDWRMERIEHVYKLIKDRGGKGITGKKIIHNLYPNADLIKSRLAEGWIQLTLAHLEKSGKIRHEVSGKKLIYRSN